jgi:hypothetical protein
MGRAFTGQEPSPRIPGHVSAPLHTLKPRTRSGEKHSQLDATNKDAAFATRAINLHVDAWCRPGLFRHKAKPPAGRGRVALGLARFPLRFGGHCRAPARLRAPSLSYQAGPARLSGLFYSKAGPWQSAFGQAWQRRFVSFGARRRRRAGAARGAPGTESAEMGEGSAGTE